MAQLIAVGLFVALCWQVGPAIIRRLSRVERNIALGGAAVILLALFALGQAVHLEQPLNRWAKLSEQFPNDARWLASRVALGAVLFLVSDLLIVTHLPPAHEPRAVSIVVWLLYFGGQALVTLGVTAGRGDRVLPTA